MIRSTRHRHHPPPGLASGAPDDRLRDIGVRVIPHIASSLVWRLPAPAIVDCALTIDTKESWNRPPSAGDIKDL